MAAAKAPTFSNDLLIKRLPWILGLLACFVYFSTINHGFVLDDIAVIEQNAFVQQGWAGIPKILTTFYWDGYWDQSSGIYRPLSLILFAIEYALSPKNPAIHHFVNIVFYGLICGLSFRVLRGLFPSISTIGLFLGLLLFIVHPAHTEVVANIKSRDELLALFFFLGACYFLFAKSERTTRHLIFAVILFLLALLSKEGILVLLPVLLIVEWLRSERKQRLWTALSLIGISLLWFSWHQHVIGQYTPVEYTYQDNSILASPDLLQQKATGLAIFGMYVLKTVYPYTLSYDYSFPQIPLASFGSPAALFGLALLLALLVVGIWSLRKKATGLFVGIALLALPLVLASHILTPIGTTMADRFLFVPSLGLALLLALLLDFFALKKPSFVRPTQVSIGILTVVFLVQAIQRNKDWESNATLFTSDVNHAPNSARVHYNFGTLLQNQLGATPSPEAVNQAFNEFTTALSLDEQYTDAYINRGTLLIASKEYTKAIENYRPALIHCKPHPEILGGLGECYYKLEQKDSALTYLQSALDNGNTHAGTYEICGTLLFEKLKFTDAERCFAEGLKSYPDNVSLLTNYGNSLAAQQKFAAAIAAFEKARSLEPNNTQLLLFLVKSYESSGNSEMAMKYTEAWKKVTGH